MNCFVILLLLISVVFPHSINYRIKHIASHNQQTPETAGGINPMTEEDMKNSEVLISFQTALRFAQDHFHQACNLDNMWTWNHVESASSQIVAGTIFRIDVALTYGQSESFALQQFKYEISIWEEPMNSQTGISIISIPKCQALDQ